MLAKTRCVMNVENRTNGWAYFKMYDEVTGKSVRETWLKWGRLECLGASLIPFTMTIEPGDKLNEVD